MNVLPARTFWTPYGAVHESLVAALALAIKSAGSRGLASENPMQALTRLLGELYGIGLNPSNIRVIGAGPLPDFIAKYLIENPSPQVKE